MFTLKELETISSGINLDSENINSLMWVHQFMFNLYLYRPTINLEIE
jgi:hypothetical protein